MDSMLEYARAGYNGRQTDAIWSSSLWSAEQAGIQARIAGILPIEVKMSKGYNVRVNRDYIFKFNTKTLDFEGITRQ